MHDIDSTLDLWDHYIGPLGPKPLNQFRRLTQNPLNDFATKFIWRYLYLDAPVNKPEQWSYIAVSTAQEVQGRHHEAAKWLRSQGANYFQQALPALTYFTNSLLLAKWEAGVDGKDRWSQPSTRVWGGFPYVYTIEFDVKSVDFFREQLRWCRSSGKTPMDAPLGRVYEHFSQYADFRGITACWSGNKSIHIHVLMDSWMAVDRYCLDRRAMRPGFIAHWDDVHRAIKEILEVPAGIEADASLKLPEQFRRLPWGNRVVKWKPDEPHILGIPEGKGVPQITLWEALRERRAGDANELFHRPEPFLIRPRSQTAAGIGGTIVSAGPLTEPERQHCEEKLRGACRRAWGEWPRLYRLEFCQNEWIARFYNSPADTNPSSIMKENYATPYLCGRDAHRVRERLDRPLGELIRIWSMTYRSRHAAVQVAEGGHDEAVRVVEDADANICWIDVVRNRDLTPLELQFQQGATSRAAVGDLTRQAVVEAVVGHDFLWLKGPEGAGKTSGLMAVHGDIMTRIGAAGRLSMYSFVSYDAARDKAKDFNDLQARTNGRYHAVVVKSWEAEYREICGRLQVEAITFGAAMEAGYHSLWEAVADLQPQAVAALEQRHRAVWGEIGHRWPVLMSQHGLMQVWTTWTHSRRFWHRDFWKVWRNRRNAPDRYAGLQAEMGLALAVYDEVAASDLLECQRADVVEWVRDLKRSSPVWRRSGKALEKYRAWDDLREAPVGLTFHDARIIAEGTNKAWQEVIVRDSGEYGEPSERSIYSRSVGNCWYVRQRNWWAGLARRVVVTTTEVLPTLVAGKLEPVTLLGQSHKKRADRQRAGWTVIELECPRLERDTVRVMFDRACTAANVAGVVERFRDAHGQDFFVITNKGQEVARTATHVGAKGSNGFVGRDIAQIMLHMSPDEHELHEVYNAWAGLDICCRLRHVDEFNQSAGRNLGFRKRGDDPHHWLIISRSLWLKIDRVLVEHSRYDFRLWISDREIKEIKTRQDAGLIENEAA